MELQFFFDGVSCKIFLVVVLMQNLCMRTSWSTKGQNSTVRYRKRNWFCLTISQMQTLIL